MTWNELVSAAKAWLASFPDAATLGDPNERALTEWAEAIVAINDKAEPWDDDGEPGLFIRVRY